MTIEDLTLHSGHILLGLCDDMRAIAEDPAQSEANRSFWRLRVTMLQQWIDAVGATLSRDVSARHQPAQPPNGRASTAEKEHDWIPVTCVVAEGGQFAFQFASGPLAGVPLSISIHGPDAALWLARNDDGEMFVRPWEAKGPEDVPRGSLVIGSYRPALLAGAAGGYEWLPIASSN